MKIRSSSGSRKLGISVAYQELSLLPRMTVLDNIMMGHYFKTKLGSVDKKKNREYAQSFLDELKAPCSLDDFAGDLPPSTQSLVEIAKAVSWQPKILLLDEVTSALHYDEVETLFTYLLRLKETGVSTVMVTHRLKEIYQICSRAVVLRGGESVADKNLEETPMEEIVFHMTGKMPEQGSAGEPHTAIVGGECILKTEQLYVGKEVRGVDVEIGRGEIIGIGGLQGQGQSEFLRALYGALPHESGTITFKGHHVHYRNAADAVRNGMGFISGDRNREAVFSIRPISENIYSANLSKGLVFGPMTKKKINSSAQQVVESHNIKIGKLSDPISSLSGGNQQKVAFGRWISAAPDFLLLDDPTKGVDVSARQELQGFLREAIQSGMTVLMVSSDNEELLAICDRIYVFYEGKISRMLSGDTLTEDHLVAAMMGLQPEEQEVERS